MARYAVRLSPRADRDLRGLSPDVAGRILKKLRELEVNPFPRGDTVSQLQGFDDPTYRLRAGDYRAVFRILGNTVVILRVLHRKEVYR